MESNHPSPKTVALQATPLPLWYKNPIEEGVRFELTELLHPPIFKIGAISLSANLPYEESSVLETHSI